MIMSVFISMLSDLLPMSSELQKLDNPLRIVLDKSVGEYFDNLPDTADELFLTSATGGWLDAWGKDYGVSRRIDESDDDYRNRIIFEKLEYLTAHNLQEIYGLTLYSYVAGFDALNNSLTSDNPYSSKQYLCLHDELLENILYNKFVVSDGIIWYSIGDDLDYIINTSNENILFNYIDIYNTQWLYRYFLNNTSIQDVKLDLPNAKKVSLIFEGCTNLETVKLNIPNVPKNNNPQLSPSSDYYFSQMFKNCSNLESIDITVRDSIKNYVKTQILNNTGLTSLTSFVLNGEEVDLS